MDGRDEDSGVIITPEAVVLDLETGGVMTRLLAGVLDAVIRIVIAFILWIVIYFVFVRGQSVDDDVSSGIVVSLYVVVTFVMFVYPIGSELLFRGRTIGKAAAGLRVVTVDGAPIRFRHAFLRGVGGLVDFWLIPLGIVGLLSVWGSSRNQRFGDMIAGTLVVRSKPLEYTSAAIWFPVPSGLDAYAETIDTTALRTDDYTVVRSFLLRVNQMSPGGRQALAQQLADGLSARLRHVRPAQVAPESFLLCVLARYQRRTVPQPAVPSAAWTQR